MNPALIFEMQFILAILKIASYLSYNHQKICFDFHSIDRVKFFTKLLFDQSYLYEKKFNYVLGTLLVLSLLVSFPLNLWYISK